MDRKCYRVSLPERNDFRAGLHAGPLLCEHKFASSKVSSGFGEKECNLYREHVLAVQVLMQTVVVSGFIVKQQRRGAQLTGLMAPSDEAVVLIGIAGPNPHRLVPAVRLSRESCVQLDPQLLDDVR